jgi:putative glycosyltransferase
MKKLSIVTTLYQSESYIREFYERITKNSDKITDDYEIIFVNDGSPDGSLEQAVALHQQDTRVCVIDLSRNFGHHKAMMTGLSYAKGEYVFLIDVDLEEEPELLKNFWDELMKNDEVDVVYGVQKKRKGNWFEKITGELFYRLINLLSGIGVPKNLVTARLMRKNYVDALVQYREQEIFLAGIWVVTGFNQVGIGIKKHSHSETTYNLTRKIQILINSITSFSNKPLVYIFYMGLIITLFSLFTVLYLVARKLLFGISFEGWTSIVASIWLLGGLIIFSIGVVGIYLSKIFIETKNRPYVSIKKMYRR